MHLAAVVEVAAGAIHLVAVAIRLGAVAVVVAVKATGDCNLQGTLNGQCITDIVVEDQAAGHSRNPKFFAGSQVLDFHVQRRRLKPVRQQFHLHKALQWNLVNYLSTTEWSLVSN